VASRSYSNPSEAGTQSVAKPKDPAPGRGRGASKAPWEAQVAGCRALRIGAHVWVTGATALRADGRVFGRGDSERQTGRALDIVEKALEKVGARIGHVVRTRVFLTDIAQAPGVERAHRARFGRPPASSIVEVSALRSPAMLVEIEAEAFVHDAASKP
jgi:enamine deaminase RidA (YjgF/YER057c/UK114 family)